MCKRASFILIAVLLVLASCNGAADKSVLSLNDSTEIAGFDASVFELTEEEAAALARGEKPAITGAFGDLPTPIFDSEPPTGLNLRGQVSSDEVVRGTSTFSYFKCAKHKKFLCTKCKPSKDKKSKDKDKKDKDKKSKVKCKKPKCGGCNDCCPPPPPPPCPRSCVTGVCNITERHWATGECGPASTDVTYAAQVYFSDGTTNRRGVEVIFKRDGVEVGRSWTDEHGVAYFKEHNVARGDYNIVVCVADCDCDSCKETCEPEEPCGPCDGKIDSLTLRYNGSSTATITANSKQIGDLGSFTVQPGGTFTVTNSGSVQQGTLGPNLVLSAGGQTTSIHTSCSQLIEIGMDFGPFTVMAGSSRNGGPLCTTRGKSSSTVVTTTPCSPCGDPDDEKESDCEYCDFEGPTYCAGRVIGVYTTCIYGAVTGTGYIDACNPLREGARAGMNFRNWYENGQVQGYLNFWDGSIKIVNEAPTWMVMAGDHAWFGNDRWMIHVKDGGANFTDDFFEIFIWDQDYHCCGNLVGCYVNISFRYTNGIDTVGVKQN